MLFRVAEIAADGQGVDVMGCQGVHRLFRFRLRGEVGDGHVRSAFGQRQGNGAADTFGRSGDEHGLSF